MIKIRLCFIIFDVVTHGYFLKHIPCNCSVTLDNKYHTVSIEEVTVGIANQIETSSHFWLKKFKRVH